jgi:S-adenosyl-L-methionine hydrolase (adenosine-forming)
MSELPAITLLTDFGLEDPYVGVLKAVLLRDCPAARIVDLTHALAPYDRIAAAFWIERTFGWFPPKTIHVVVVDPGVGSERRGLVIAAHDQFFVGPDNGVLSGIFARDPRADARQIDQTALGVGTLSRTFHGRDVFAPVAARLACGTLAFSDVGQRISSVCAAALPTAAPRGRGFVGQVVTVDRFGNALTNLLEPGSEGRYQVHVAGRCLPVLGTYSDCAVGEMCGIFGSFGTLELAMREGHAAAALGVASGASVELSRID